MNSLRVGRILVLALAAAGLWISTSPDTYAVEETPHKIDGGALVDAPRSKALADKGAVVIDARVPAEYAEMHIKGAKSVLYREVHPRESKLSPDDKFDLAKLPAEKNTPLVFYCNGSPCWKGYKAAAAAIKAGYTHVYWFRDGLPAWMDKGYPVE
jgi:rhodanese-related sulfurtransferase